MYTSPFFPRTRSSVLTDFLLASKAANSSNQSGMAPTPPSAGTSLPLPNQLWGRRPRRLHFKLSHPTVNSRLQWATLWKPRFKRCSRLHQWPVPQLFQRPHKPSVAPRLRQHSRPSVCLTARSSPLLSPLPPPGLGDQTAYLPPPFRAHSQTNMHPDSSASPVNRPKLRAYSWRELDP